MSQMNWAVVTALSPLVLIVLVFVVWCLIDMQQRETRYLPRWAWMAITILSIPTGGIVYVLIGRGTPYQRAPR